MKNNHKKKLITINITYYVIEYFACEQFYHTAFNSRVEKNAVNKTTVVASRQLSNFLHVSD